MTNRLTTEQRNHINTALRVGGDRETAAKFAHTTWAKVHAAMQADPAFAAEVRNIEACVEVSHLQQLRKASETPANWRISAWWLERLHPERYGPRGAGTFNARELKKFVEQIAAVLVEEVQHKEDRERLVRRLERMTESLELFLRDDFSLVDLDDDFDDEDDAVDPFASPNGAPHHDDEEDQP